MKAQGDCILDIEKITFVGKKGNPAKSHPISLLDLVNSEYDQWVLIDDIGGINRVYEKTNPGPRVRLVQNVVSLEKHEVFNAIKTSVLPDGSHFDPRRTALVEEAYSLEKTPDSDASCRISIFESDVIEIKTNSSNPSFLVLSDLHYPGWEATVDGEETKILLTNYILRGVAIPPGKHIVRFLYRPWSFYIGLSISVCFIITLILFLKILPNSKQ